MQRRRRLPFERLASFVDLESGPLEMIDHSLGELLASVIWRVLLEDPTQQGTTACDREADREGELVAEGSVIHGMFLFCSHQRTPDPTGAVKAGNSPVAW